MRTTIAPSAPARLRLLESAVAPLARLFSEALEEPVSVRQTLCILQVMLAALVAVFSLAVPMVLRVLAVAWLWMSLRQCRQAGLGKDSDWDD